MTTQILSRIHNFHFLDFTLCSALHSIWGPYRTAK